jgi:micrococcal nuclease
MVRTLAIALFLVAAGSAVGGPRAHEPWTVTGEAGRVYDGDTFDLRTRDRGVIRVRFSGIDAPERGQAFSRKATEYLQLLLEKQAVTARCYKDDGNEREVCDVVVNGRDVGLAMIRAGFAWHFKRFEAEQDAETRELYSRGEEEARAKGAGIWSQLEPMAPWDCRKAKRDAVSCR